MGDDNKFVIVAFFSFIVVDVNKVTTTSLLLSPILKKNLLEAKKVMVANLLMLPFFLVDVATKKTRATNCCIFYFLF